jgi:hypothetical protein
MPHQEIWRHSGSISSYGTIYRPSCIPISATLFSFNHKLHKTSKPLSHLLNLNNSHPPVTQV